jgi:hypothetical protein
MFYISVAATAILVAYGLYSKRKERMVSETTWPRAFLCCVREVRRVKDP